MDGGEAGTLAPRAGADLASIPGVGSVAVKVDSHRVHVRPTVARPRLKPAVAGLVALILLPAAYAATIGSRSSADAVPQDVAVRSLEAPAPATAAGPTDLGARAAASAPAAAVEAPPVFARFDDLPIHLPNEDVVLVGFHEASLDDALQMTPHGEIAMNENTTKFSAPAAAPDGPRYVVLSSRGRVHPATSAVDVVLRDDVPVRSVVSGTVTDVRPYALYGRYEDTRIEIQPTGRPDLRVVLIHVSEVAVRVGDAVTAGETVLAGSANRFPFASHIDRYTEPDRWPHVHLEVKRAG